ncbi:MAG: GTPase HflX [Spirochaetia bacterium]|nr:GTPase HflX [Spirochaetia bacterium]
MEKVLLVKIVMQKDERDLNSDIEEMKGLISTAGGEVIDIILQKRADINPGFYIGKGKADEIAEKYKDSVDVIIVDGELRPIQAKNLEDTTGIRVIDRTQLILDIFARRASTAEGKLQVEYAQLNYLMPRLLGRGSSFMQQTGGLRGGVGTRGPGETKLEADRRTIKKRIQRIRDDLEEVKAKRERQRDRRRSVPVPQVAIVGYTNAGKSMLMNTLTKAGMLSEDKLFATLDPKIKRYTLPSRCKVLFSDTVGFIKNLPTSLIAAFRATLEEVCGADIILHIIDISEPGWEDRIGVVYGILKEIDAYEGKRIIEVYNKIDLVPPANIPILKNKKAVFISAKTGEGLDKLTAEIDRQVSPDFLQKEIKITDSGEKSLKVFYEEGVVLGIDFTAKGNFATVKAMKKTFDKYEKMTHKEKSHG